MTPLVNVVLKGCRAMVLSFILLSIFGTSVSILGVHFDERTWMATKVHPNRKYFTRKNILVYLRIETSLALYFTKVQSESKITLVPHYVLYLTEKSRLWVILKTLLWEKLGGILDLVEVGKK